LAGRRRPGPELPGRTVADRVSLPEPRHRGVVHAAKVIIGSVVFADVIAAEAEIFALALAAFGRAEHPLGDATGKRARGRRRLFRRPLDGLHPDTVEQTGVQIHSP